MKDLQPNDEIGISNVNVGSIESTNIDDTEHLELIQDDLKIDDNDSIASPKEIKGFKRDSNKHIVCLDCGKKFTAKNSYNYHKRM